MTQPDVPLLLLSREQLQVRLGKTFSEAETPRVDAALSAASNLVRDLVSQAAGLDWSTADHLSPAVPSAAREVVLATVRRELENPRGLVTWSKTIGRWSKTERLADGTPVGLLLSEQERASILLALGVMDFAGDGDEPWSGTISARAGR